jgi:hypothetical protein
VPDEPAADSGIPEGDLRQLARGLSTILREMHQLAADSVQEPLAARIGEHLGVDPKGLPILSHEFPDYQLVDVQVALEAWVDAAPDRSSVTIGVSGDQRRFHPLSELLSQPHFGVGVGPVEYVDVADSPDSTRSCVRFGVLLLVDGGHRSAVLLRGADPHGPMQSAMLEIVAADQSAAQRLMGELRRLAVERSVLRGRVLALGPGKGMRYGRLRFMPRPKMGRDELVLPDATWARSNAKCSASRPTSRGCGRRVSTSSGT